MKAGQDHFGSIVIEGIRVILLLKLHPISLERYEQLTHPRLFQGFLPHYNQFLPLFRMSRKGIYPNK